MKTRRGPVSLIAALAIIGLLVGCSYVNRVAARLHPDGSLDFATCDARDVESLEVRWYYEVSGSRTDYESRHETKTAVVGAVHEGDVFHLDATAPKDAWAWVSVSSDRNGNGTYLVGTFDAEDLASGEWVWNQTGIFIGTVDVEHCSLDEENAR